MNELVDAVNSQISAAVQRAGDKVKFVDYDSYVAAFVKTVSTNQRMKATQEPVSCSTSAILGTPSAVIPGNEARTVLGYVRTGYLGVSQQKFLTRLGSGNLADWTA